MCKRFKYCAKRNENGERHTMPVESYRIECVKIRIIT